jgi:hypothetical protein
MTPRRCPCQESSSVQLWAEQRLRARNPNRRLRLGARTPSPSRTFSHSAADDGQSKLAGRRWDLPRIAQPSMNTLEDGLWNSHCSVSTPSHRFWMSPHDYSRFVLEYFPNCPLAECPKLRNLNDRKMSFIGQISQRRFGPSRRITESMGAVNSIRR